MHDQSFCRKTLERVLRKHEFRNVPVAEHKAFREAILTGATTSAATCFNAPNNPLKNFPLRGKLVYRLVGLQDELVLRQLVRNVKRCMPRAEEGRRARGLRCLHLDGPNDGQPHHGRGQSNRGNASGCSL